MLELWTQSIYSSRGGNPLETPPKMNMEFQNNDALCGKPPILGFPKFNLAPKWALQKEVFPTMGVVWGPV